MLTLEIELKKVLETWRQQIKLQSLPDLTAATSNQTSHSADQINSAQCAMNHKMNTTC